MSCPLDQMSLLLFLLFPVIITSLDSSVGDFNMATNMAITNADHGIRSSIHHSNRSNKFNMARTLRCYRSSYKLYPTRVGQLDLGLCSLQSKYFQLFESFTRYCIVERNLGRQETTSLPTGVSSEGHATQRHAT